MLSDVLVPIEIDQVEGNTESRWERCGTTQNLHYNVYGLSENGTYRFRVSALNIFGKSRPSTATTTISMSPDTEYQREESFGQNDPAPFPSVSIQGCQQDSIFQAGFSSRSYPKFDH